MLYFPRASEAFAGVSLAGISLGPDGGAHENPNGRKFCDQSFDPKVQAPPAAHEAMLDACE